LGPIQWRFGENWIAVQKQVEEQVEEAEENSVDQNRWRMMLFRQKPGEEVNGRF